jgi:hypothetical protein
MWALSPPPPPPPAHLPDQQEHAEADQPRQEQTQLGQQRAAPKPGGQVVARGNGAGGLARGLAAARPRAATRIGRLRVVSSLDQAPPPRQLPAGPPAPNAPLPLELQNGLHRGQSEHGVVAPPGLPALHERPDEPAVVGRRGVADAHYKGLRRHEARPAWGRGRGRAGAWDGARRHARGYLAFGARAGKASGAARPVRPSLLPPRARSAHPRRAAAAVPRRARAAVATRPQSLSPSSLRPSSASGAPAAPPAAPCPPP